MKNKRRIFIFYAGILLATLVFPHWLQGGGYVGADLEKVRGIYAPDTEEGREGKKIALTFDDGPDSEWTPVLLDGLREREIKASFFLIGCYAEENPEIVKRMDEEGHLIGNHTYHHVSLAESSEEAAEEEIRMTDQVIYEITGEHTGYVRPPFGAWREELEEKMEIIPVMWNIDPLDWQSEDTGEIVQKVVTEAREGAIILLHDCYGASVVAALEITDILTEKGYEFVTVDEILMG